MAFWDDIVNKLSQTWPARMGQGILGAAALPGDVYAGRTDPGSNEAIGRAADLAGILGGSAFVAPAQRNAVGAGIRAYHGSPYDFAKFDLSKIGTGEGAQSYGHGLYFAENPKVAESYRSDPWMNQYVNSANYNPIQGAAAQRFYQNKGDINATIAELNDRIKNSHMYGDTTASVADLQGELKLLQSGWQPPRGKMYEVNINAKPEQFLNYDQPLAAQPNVEAVMRKAGFGDAPWPYADRLIGSRDRTLIDRTSEAGQAYQALARELGGQREIGTTAKYPVPYTNEAAASQALQEAGIPGIRYLDQGSRDPARWAQDAAGKWFKEPPPQTSNYVVFNPEIVDILKKYGLVGALGASQLTPQGNEQ